MGLFHRRKNMNTLIRFDNSVLRCITERSERGDKVLAKHGYITVREGLFRVSGENEDILCVPVDTVNCSELMSGDGVIVSALDGTFERTLICYYLYYRKLSTD